MAVGSASAQDTWHRGDDSLVYVARDTMADARKGIISIKAIARIPGERAKIAVESYDERIDAVGACVGVKGSRIHGIVRELKNENIDVIDYTTNTSLFIQRALSPAKISSMRVDENTKHAEVFLHPEEVSLAIGKGGMNIRHALGHTSQHSHQALRHRPQPHVHHRQPDKERLFSKSMETGFV